MRLHELPRQRRAIVILTLALLLLTFAFPYAEYGYSAGFPRGEVIWEFHTVEIEYDPVDAVAVGRGSEFWGRGIIPCWNITGKDVRWDWVIAQAAALAALGFAGFALSPNSGPARRPVHGEPRTDTQPANEAAPSIS